LFTNNYFKDAEMRCREATGLCLLIVYTGAVDALLTSLVMRFSSLFEIGRRLF